MQGTFSARTLQDLRRRMDDAGNFLMPKMLGNPLGSFLGMPVRESPLFPMEMACPKCEGTGEGEASTYCPRCSGAGRLRTEGMIEHQGTYTLLNVKLPRKFEPSFPLGLVPPRSLATGLA